jgi:NagD protein
MGNDKMNNMTYDKAFIIDMDGVINTGRSLIPGATAFVEKLKKFKYKL